MKAIRLLVRCRDTRPRPVRPGQGQAHALRALESRLELRESWARPVKQAARRRAHSCARLKAFQNAMRCDRAEARCARG